MSKKKKARDKDKKDEAVLPKFGGFLPLAGLSELKAKLEAEASGAKRSGVPGGVGGETPDAEAKAEAEKAKARGAPPPAPKPRPAPAPARTAAKSGSAADEELSFHRLMAGVTPLDGDKSRVPVAADARGGARVRPKVDELRERARVEAEEVRAHLHRLVDDVARFEVSDDGRRVEGRRSDVPPDVLRTLRRGLLPIDARLDLHGLSAEDARDRLLAFLRDKRAAGERCVLVIHGKGESVPGGGVLRGEIAAWLSQGRAREHVAAFATARDDDGGEGAVYVALRR